MSKPLFTSVLTAAALLSAGAATTTSAFAFTPYKVSRYPDGCVRHTANKASSKTQRKREKTVTANALGRGLSTVYRGSGQ